MDRCLNVHRLLLALALLLVAAPQAVAAPRAAGPVPCPDGATRASASPPGAGSISLADIGAAYGTPALYAAGNQGEGQTVGIYAAHAFHPEDIATFESCYGITAPVTAVPIKDGPSSTTFTDEVDLDVEAVLGMAPKASVLVYEGDSVAEGLAAMVADNRASVLTFSYGGCETSQSASSAKALDAQLKQAAAQGQSVLFSSGDYGSTHCYDSTAANPNTTPTPSSYASQPFVTGVGGTMLWAQDGNTRTVYRAGLAPVEGVWNGGPGGTGKNASTGGISTKFPMPDYQSTAAAALDVKGGGSGTPCGSTAFCRESPDVSANAAGTTGYRIYAQGEWTKGAGTSASAPVWAGMLALANASPACGGRRVGFANPVLYKLASTNYAANFTDITLPSFVSGLANNDVLGVNNGLYPLKTGFDMATGLGSPHAPAIVSGLCNGGATAYTVAVANPGPQSATTGTPVSVALKATDSGKATLSYAATGLPPGLAVDPTSGVITGSPTGAGTFSTTVTVTDDQRNAGTTSFEWRVGSGAAPTAPRLSKVSLAPSGSRRARLRLSIGGGSTPIQSVSIKAPKHVRLTAKGTRVVDAGAKAVAASAKVAGGRLVLTLSSPQTAITVATGSRGLKLTRKLAKRLRRHKAIGRFAVSPTDSAGAVTSLSATPRWPRGA